MTFADLRRKQGLTQQQLANELGVTQSTVAMWETGKAMPRMQLVSILAKKLNVDTNTIVESLRHS